MISFLFLFPFFLLLSFLFFSFLWCLGGGGSRLRRARCSSSRLRARGSWASTCRLLPLFAEGSHRGDSFSPVAPPTHSASVPSAASGAAGDFAYYFSPDPFHKKPGMTAAPDSGPSTGYMYTVKACLRKCSLRDLSRAVLSSTGTHSSYITLITIYSRHTSHGPPFSLLMLVRILL